MVGFDSVVAFLLSKGADPALANAEGKAPKDVALNKGTAAVFDKKK